MNARSHRIGFSLVEILVVTAIIGVLIGILLPAIQRVRESTKLAECENNMRQLGLALAAFHDSHRAFPLGQNQRANTTIPPSFPGPGIYPQQSTVFIDMLPYIDQGNQVDTWQTNPQPVNAYLCPSRQSTTLGARDDYGFGQHPHAFTGGTYAGVSWFRPPTHPLWREKWSILGGIYRSATKLNQIVTHDGSSNTALLAHKGMEPAHYSGSTNFAPRFAQIDLDFGNNPAPVDDDKDDKDDKDKPANNPAPPPAVPNLPSVPNDQGWASLANYWEHARYPGFFGKDKRGLVAGWNNQPANATPNSHQLMTSPHEGGMPTLMADGSVRIVSYRMDRALVGFLWSWNDRVVVE